MLILLLLYLAPVLATALFWHAQRTHEGPGAWDSLVSGIRGRGVHARAVVGALFLAVAVVTAEAGPRGAAAFLLGVLLSVQLSALAHAASGMLERAMDDDPSTTADLWTASFGAAQAPAALAAGVLAVLAWFFGDPAGAVVLLTFVTGVAAGALFLGMVLGAPVEPREMPGTLRDAGPATERGRFRRGVVSAATGPVHLHLPAVAAALLIAATAEPESLLYLGGLMAETETLRSELLLVPIAVCVLSPVLAFVGGPLFGRVLEHRAAVSLFWMERLAAVLAGLVVVALVLASGLAWVVGAAFVVGLAARQLAVAADELATRTRRYAALTTPSLAPALLSAAAVACGDHLAGTFGVALVALGMTATFASSAAAATAWETSGNRGVVDDRAAGRPNALCESTAGVTVGLALLAAVAPVLLADASHRGLAVALVVTAAPALLVGVVAGAACAATASRRFARPDSEAEAVGHASRAVVLAFGVPALAGMLLGAGAAVGAALGFVAWATADRCITGGPGQEEDGAVAMPGALVSAWGRTMALATVVGVPLMNG